MFFKMIQFITHQIQFLMNIDETREIRENTGKLRGYTYKIIHILAFNCPIVANLVPYQTA